MNNQLIQVLRGGENYDPSTSDVVLKDGQPFYSKQNKRFYIGETDIPISQLIPFVNKEEVDSQIEGSSREIHDVIDAYVTTHNNIKNGTGDYSIEQILSTDGTRYNQADGAYSVALGQQGKAYGRGSMSVGNSTQAGVKDLEEWQTLPGKETADQADMDKYNRYQVVMGASNKALGGHSFAGGGFSTALGFESFAFGYQAKANNNYAISLGYQTQASGLRSISLGNKSTASGVNAISIGYGSEALAEDSIAIGWKSADYSNKSNGKKSLAVGIGNTIQTDNSISIGYHNKTAGAKKNIFQFGANLSSEYENTIALGYYNNDRYVDNANKGILLSVGNGTASARSNAFEVLRDGRAKVMSQPIEENDVLRWQEKEVLAGYISDENRRAVAQELALLEDLQSITKHLSYYDDLSYKGLPYIGTARLKISKHYGHDITEDYRDITLRSEDPKLISHHQPAGGYLVFDKGRQQFETKFEQVFPIQESGIDTVYVKAKFYYSLSDNYEISIAGQELSYYVNAPDSGDTLGDLAIGLTDVGLELIPPVHYDMVENPQKTGYVYKIQ